MDILAERINQSLQNQTQIIEQLLLTVFQDWKMKYPRLLTEIEFRAQTQQLINELNTLFRNHADPDNLPEISDQASLVHAVQQVSKAHAELGIRAGDTAKYISQFKSIILSFENTINQENERPLELILMLDHVINNMAVLSFDSYMLTRERIIAQQSESLLELSSPALRLWDKVVLVPLVGIIDTIRARLFTEHLLEAISEYEASVAIIDVTAVPVFDTGVAHHIMKSIQAASLLGSHVIMTGLSPEGAQILTKLGISFENVTSRPSLRAGIAEAMHMIGYRITLTTLQ